jgi:hypothetical protein
VSERTFCGKCKNQRFLHYHVKWDARSGKLAGAWRAFDRGCWNELSGSVLSLLRVNKSLKGCGDCNADELPPWHEKFRATDAGSEPESAGAPPA